MTKIHLALLALLILITPSAFADTITSALTSTATVGTAFSYQITTSTAATQYAATGLPTGLTYISSSGLVDGTPTTSGVYTVSLAANLSDGQFVSAKLVLTVNAAGTTKVTPLAVTLSCTPSTASTTANPGTVTLLRSTGANSTIFTSLVIGLAPNCAYVDAAVLNGTIYNYEAEFLQNGETSGPSNIAVVAIPALVTTTTPTVSVVASATSPASNTAVEVTISVTGTGTVPTGSIVVVGAGFTSAASVLTNGTVVITIPVNTLTTGASNFVATYTPDATSSSVYNTATGSEAVIVIPAAPAALGGTVN